MQISQQFDLVLLSNHENQVKPQDIIQELTEKLLEESSIMDYLLESHSRLETLLLGIPAYECENL